MNSTEKPRNNGLSIAVFLKSGTMVLPIQMLYKLNVKRLILNLNLNLKLNNYPLFVDPLLRGFPTVSVKSPISPHLLS